MRFLFIFCFSVLLSFNVNSFNPLKDVGDLVPGVGGIIKELGDAINEENKKKVKDKKDVQGEGNKKKIEKQQADQNKQQEEVNAIVEKHKNLRKQAKELNISDDLKTEVGKKDPFCYDQANKVYLISLTENSKVREVVEANEILEKYIACKKDEEKKIAAERKRIEMAEKKNSDKMAELAKSDPWILFDSWWFKNIGPYQLQNIYLLGMSKNERQGLINLEARCFVTALKLRIKEGWAIEDKLTELKNLHPKSSCVKPDNTAFMKQILLKQPPYDRELKARRGEALMTTFTKCIENISELPPSKRPKKANDKEWGDYGKYCINQIKTRSFDVVGD